MGSQPLEADPVSGIVPTNGRETLPDERVAAVITATRNDDIMVSTTHLRADCGFHVIDTN